MAGPVTKIATCCYCGTRAALVLRGKDRHELACASCGAPLHSLKMLKAPVARSRWAETKPARSPRAHPPARQRKKRPKPLWRRRLHQIAELFDDLEDLFD